MKHKFFYTGIVLALVLFSSVASATKLPPNWQFAYKDNGAIFYFDTNTLHTIETTHIDDDPADDDATVNTTDTTAATTATTSATSSIAAAITTVDTATDEDDNIIGVKMKTVLSSTLLQELIDAYKNQYDTTSWFRINYCTSYNIYNRTDKTLLTKNVRFFDANNNLMLTINKETKSTVSSNSVQSKIYDNIFNWMDEN
ncbi:hypothetical protein SAMN05660742_10219 [Propionispira arboris]|uniref:DUF1795 domain-containing protein n=1 Tax=Propionispira arboris TaxID=84035 RepID=A0A1H6V2C1_9FIRM|nr:hypothetical protein [Propionispira arboris]SEI94405.1 hypothetical protein SAMN05660742_10219 [Propionispira arboris]